VTYVKTYSADRRPAFALIGRVIAVAMTLGVSLIMPVAMDPPSEDPDDAERLFISEVELERDDDSHRREASSAGRERRSCQAQ
jgi:hypothetical protein